MDLPDCPPGAEGYQDSVVTEVSRKLEDSTYTKAEIEFQKHLNSLKIKLEDGSTRPMVERSGHDVSGKWIYLCYPCAAVCSGESILQSHISGKKHKTKLALRKSWPLSIYEDHPYHNHSSKPVAPTDKVLLKMAHEVDIHNKATSELEKEFDKYRNIACLLQKALDATKAPLIGLEYLIAHPPEQAHRQPKYICTLCSKQGYPRSIINHITCFWHRYNYILRHFPKACHVLSPYIMPIKYREGVNIVIGRLIQRIEDKYGRMRPVNVDKEEYEKDKERIHQWILKGDHFAEKEGCTFEEVVDIGLIESLNTELTRKSPDPRRTSDPARRESEDSEHAAANSRRQPRQHKRRQYPEPRRRSPEPRCRSPEPRRRSPEPRRRSPEPRRRSPIVRQRSPLRRRSPDIRRDHGSPVRRSPVRRVSTERHRSPLSRRLRSRSRSPLRSDDGLSLWDSENEIGSVDSMSSFTRVMSRGSKIRPRTRRRSEDHGGPDDVVATLRLIVALEDYLGSLGPKFIDLLAEALKMEKEKANSSKELLVRDSAVVLIETAKEKLKGAAQAGLISGSAATAARAAVVRAAATLHEADKRQRKKQQEKASASATTNKSAVPVGGVGEVERAQITQQMAEALIAQGKTDVSPEELVQLVEAVFGMAEAKKREAERRQPEIWPVPKQALSSVVTPKTSGTATAQQILQSPYDENDKKIERENAADAIDGLSDSDLETLLKNFNELSAEEHHMLIAYLKKLEAREPARVERLRQYVSDAAHAPPSASAGSAVGAGRATSPPPPPPPAARDALVVLESDDDDDYTVEEVFQSATQKVKEDQIRQEGPTVDCY